MRIGGEGRRTARDGALTDSSQGLFYRATVSTDKTTHGSIHTIIMSPITFCMKAGLTISLASSFRTLSVSSAVLCKSTSNREVMDADENMCVSSRKCTVPAGDVIWAQISPASTMFKMWPSASSGCVSPTLSEMSVNGHGKSG